MLDRRKCWGFRWEASLSLWAPFCKENQFHLFPCSTMFHHVPPCSIMFHHAPPAIVSNHQSVCNQVGWWSPITLRTKLRSLAPWSSIPPSCDPGQNPGGDLPVAPRRLCCDVAKGSIRVVGAVVLSKCLNKIRFFFQLLLVGGFNISQLGWGFQTTNQFKSNGI